MHFWVAVISAKNHKRQRRKRQSVTAKREKSQTTMVLTAILTLPNLTYELWRLRLFSFGGYGLALAALALVVFGAIECPPHFLPLAFELPAPSQAIAQPGTKHLTCMKLGDDRLSWMLCVSLFGDERQSIRSRKCNSSNL